MPQESQNVKCRLNAIKLIVAFFYIFTFVIDINHKGCFAEYEFATRCLKKGFSPSFPLLDSSPYDLIIDDGNRLFKIQVKYTSVKRKDGNQYTVTISPKNAKGKYEVTDVDYYAIYVKQFDGFFVIPNRDGFPAKIHLSNKGKYSKYFNNFVFS